MTFPLGPLIPLTAGLLVSVLLVRLATTHPRALRRVLPWLQRAMATAVTLRIVALLILRV